MAAKHKNTPASKATPARQVAFEMLSLVRQRNCYLSQVAPEVLDRAHLSSSDRAFAYLLAQGALSLQLSLDSLIDATLKSPHDIKANVRDALRLSTYEILYLNKQNHAAVDQGVELVRMVAPRACGLANFVLRRIAEVKDKFPFGCIETDVVACARYCGFPLWLANLLEKQWGSDETIAFMRESLEPAPVWFQLNSCLESGNELLGLLQSEGINTHSVSLLESLNSSSGSICFQLENRIDVSNVVFASLLSNERVIVSDISAQRIVEHTVSLLPKTGTSMLEIGAGRGTKTLLFHSSAMRHNINFSTYDALDVSPRKVKQLALRASQAGVSISSAIAHDATTPLPKNLTKYNMVFIDAPCSGVGTLRRHPEIKSRLNLQDSSSLAEVGLRILHQVSSRIAPGGYVVYATCTVLEQENEAVIQRFLESEAGVSFQLVPFGVHGENYFKTPLIPGGPDLHFAACLQKRCAK